MKYEIYGLVHKLMRKILKKDKKFKFQFVNVHFDDIEKGFINSKLLRNCIFFNELLNPTKISKASVYPVENIISLNSANYFEKTYQKKNRKKVILGIEENEEKYWNAFLDNSVIEPGYKYAGLHYGGCIKEYQQWSLPSWIWTNAALVRCYCLLKNLNKARSLGELILKYQTNDGGWIVRNDYSSTGAIPILAPNDSAYIALNCCIELYLVLNEKKYLDSAEKTAKWIIETAREDGLVWFGYDIKNKVWIKDKNIVDIGFTAGLFAQLYHCTQKEEYLLFLNKFIKSYINTFYLKDKHCFSTAINHEDKPFGGAFGRGQGWALEGLIPAYRILKDNNLKLIIEETIETLLASQLKNGAWSYNLFKPMMGEDCKCVSVIANCLLEWNKIKNDVRLIVSAKKAIDWCKKHTAKEGILKGGIFSYSIEGAMVHTKYSSTAVVYASAYALEVRYKLDAL